MAARVLFFVLLLGIGLTMPWWFTLAAALLYVFMYDAYELILLGGILDAQFGVGLVPLIYTLAFTVLVVGASILKPHLSFYEESL